MNLITSGCSFTKWQYQTWPQFVAEELDFQLIQRAFAGAGNYYIRRSIQDYLQDHSLDKNKTIVIVMWSGITRRDLEISEECLKIADSVTAGTINNRHFLTGGGGFATGSWFKERQTKNYYNSIYKITDDRTHLNNTLDNINSLYYCLEYYGIKSIFMSYSNNFTSNDPYIAHDVSAQFCNPHFDYKKELLGNWINLETESLWEFGNNNKLLTKDGFHPNQEAHKRYAEKFIIPKVKELL